MTEVQSTGVSRRRIIQGAAWATPAIMIAAAAPAAASSTTPPSIQGSARPTSAAGTRSITFSDLASSSLVITNITITVSVDKIKQNSGADSNTADVVSSATSPWTRTASASATDKKAQTATVTYSLSSPTGITLTALQYTLSSATVTGVTFSVTYKPTSTTSNTISGSWAA